ncbi:MAG: aldo/keto reductase [Acetobacteraceae bacterium]|nr:aldo/keto reductase [Acetobacteraceae bacterium]
MTGYIPRGPLGMGSAPLGNLITEVPEADAAACVEAGWAAGIRHFDTAPHYGAGLAEHRLGRFLRTRARDEYTLSTKIGRILHADAGVPALNENFLNALPFRRSIDYSAAGTIRSLEDSQQRMGLTRFDIVYIHDCSEDWHGSAWRDRFAEAMAGAARELSAMRARGEIRAWGMGLNMVEPALACLEAADPDIFLIAGRYTLIDHTALGKLFPACAAKGAKVVIGGPYNSGLLAGGTTFNYEPAKAEIVAKAQAVRAVCDRHGVDIRAAALQFCAAHPVVAAVIPGPRSAVEATGNAALIDAEIPGQFWRDLRSAGLLPDGAPTPEP